MSELNDALTAINPRQALRGHEGESYKVTVTGPALGRHSTERLIELLADDVRGLPDSVRKAIKEELERRDYNHDDGTEDDGCTCCDTRSANTVTGYECPRCGHLPKSHQGLAGADDGLALNFPGFPPIRGVGPVIEAVETPEDALDALEKFARDQAETPSGQKYATYMATIVRGALREGK